VYLTGKPEVSFFRQKYSRHTNFAMKPVELLPMGSVSANGEVSLKIPNKGDIICGVWLDHGDSEWENRLGSRLTKPTVLELYIGGQMIDRQDSTFANIIWPSHLVDSGAKGMFGDVTRTSRITPLHFSFCDNYGLPLVALQYHEVEIKIKFSSVDPNPIKFYAEYIVLDTSEREWFTNNDHTLLIEQVQKIPPTVGGTNPVWDLSLLNHPVKSLHFTDVTDGSNYSIGNNAMLYLNGTQVFDSPMGTNFFVLAQPYYHCEHYSEVWRDEVQSSAVCYPHMYSFAMKASKHVPTGSCNFSRLDNAEFKATGASDSTNVNMYAVNWNILRIKQGMAGLAFSN
jgi:hypothetical protein